MGNNYELHGAGLENMSERIGSWENLWRVLCLLVILLLCPVPFSGHAASRAVADESSHRVGIFGAYIDYVESQMRLHWDWSGKASGKKLMTVVHIQIAKDGTIEDAQIVTSSGNSSFDAAVIRAAEATQKLELPPRLEIMEFNMDFTPVSLGGQ